MPYLYPEIPDAHKLWRNNPTLQGMTVADARKEVNELFKTAILARAGTPPCRSTLPPFHQGHAVKEVAICYGANSPIDRIGMWYAKCTRHTAVRWLYRAIAETDLFFDEHLNRLLFMREELKPKPKNDKTAAEAYKTSIERSVCYFIAFSDMYPPLTSQIHKLPDEDASSPIQTKSESPPVNSRKRPLATRSPSTRPTKRHAPSSNTSPSPVKQYHSSLMNGSNNTASSSQPTMRTVDRIPIFIVAWIQNGVDPVILATRTRRGDELSLTSQKHILKANGITRSAYPSLERYTIDGTWIEFPWDSTFSPVKMGQPVLLRVHGLSNLADFAWMKMLAQA